jgi:hypothetical protein
MRQGATSVKSRSQRIQVLGFFHSKIQVSFFCVDAEAANFSFNVQGLGEATLMICWFVMVAVERLSQLKEMCGLLPDCAGFSTSGWLKKEIVPFHKFKVATLAHIPS